MIGEIKDIIIHGIGNKSFSDGLKLSQGEVELADEVKDSLCLSLREVVFSDATYQFFHESGELQLNPMYVYADRVFNHLNFVETSCNIARQLYENSDHPKIPAGELLVVLFDNCEFKGEKCKALGLFKSESKDKFFDFKYSKGSYSIVEQEGLNIGALKKGVIIYNTEKGNGYRVSVLMRANKQVDAKYWLNDFLHITQVSDSFYRTQQLIALTKNYVREVLSTEEGISRVEQTEILSRAANYLSTNDSFDDVSYSDEVFRNEKYKDDFRRYSEETDSENSLLEPFEIDKSEVKKKSRLLKSVIKLDKNFHIYVHGGEGLIKKGYDPESGMAFYQLYFKEEE